MKKLLNKKLEELKNLKKTLEEKIIENQKNQKELVLNLHNLRTAELNNKLQYFSCDTQITILEALANKEQYDNNIRKEKNANERIIDENPSKLIFDINKSNKESSNYKNILSNKAILKANFPKETHKELFLENYFDEFFKQYHTHFRSMDKLSVCDEMLTILSKTTYKEWEENLKNDNILLAITSAPGRFYGKLVIQDNKKYYLILPHPEIKLTEADIKMNALDKFFEIEGEVLLNETNSDRRMIASVPGIVVQRNDGYYELKKKGSLKFE